MQVHITIIGAGIAGILAANILADKGYKVILIEKEETIGGKLTKWNKLFPTNLCAENVLNSILNTNIKFKILTSTQVISSQYVQGRFIVQLSNKEKIVTETVLLTTGYKLFNALRKEEYGYGIFDKVITSFDLEGVLKRKKNIHYLDNVNPGRIAFVHCVGSRDEKVGNTYCSKLCCITAVKQAIELKKLYPLSEIYCLYMDLRMYDRYFEKFYKSAQEDYSITFIRGRLSEAAESVDGQIYIKLEDTLACRPLKIAVDLLVLMGGMEATEESEKLGRMFGLPLGEDGFFLPKDEYIDFNQSSHDGVFLAGTCKGPKNISETIADARSAIDSIINYLEKVNN